jgi:ribonuclease HII
LITDYLILPELEPPQTALVKGDLLVLSVSCASILAKTARDRLMVAAGKSYPGYGFEQHKGYGTLRHRQAVAQWGYTPLHRLTFQCIPAAPLADESEIEVD